MLDLKEYFTLNNFHDAHEPFVLYADNLIGAGTTAEIFRFNSNGQRRGCIYNFEIGFIGISPPPSSPLVSYSVTFDGVLIPRSDTLNIFDYSLFLSQKINYFIPLNGQSVQSLIFSMTNTDIVAYYSYMIIEGMYLNENT